MKHLKNYPYYQHTPVDTLEERLDFSALEYRNVLHFDIYSRKRSVLSASLYSGKSMFSAKA